MMYLPFKEHSRINSKVHMLMLSAIYVNAVKTTPNLNIESNFFRCKSFVYSFAFPRLRISRLGVWAFSRLGVWQFMHVVLCCMSTDRGLII